MTDGMRNTRVVTRRALCTALFAAAVLCFLLPFGTVSCSGEREVHVTGVELATRSVPDADTTAEGPNLAQQVEDEGFFWAFAALASLLLGLALAAFRPEALGKALLTTSVGMVAMLGLPATAVVELADFTLEAGFILVLTIEILLVFLYIGLLIDRRHGRKHRGSVVPPRTVPQ